MKQQSGNQQIHLHGGDIEAAYKQYGRKRYLDLSISINPWGPPLEFWFHFMGNLLTIKKYPQPYTTNGRELLGRFFDFNPDFFVLGNGGAELIRNLPVTLPVERAVIFEPTFSEYEQAFGRVNKPVIKVALNSNFNLSIPGLVEVLKPNDMVFICQPNNPTGNLFDENSLLELLKITKTQNCWLVIDESFLWFCGDILKLSFQRYLLDYPNLIIINSLTKIGAIPGLRLGFLITHSEIAEKIRQSLDPWCVNHLAQKTIGTILQPSYLAKTIHQIQKENSWLQKKFADISELQIYPWNANFYLLKFDTRKIQHQDCISQLGRAGLLVRDCSNFPNLGPGYIRVAVGRRSQNKKFITKLRSILKI